MNLVWFVYVLYSVTTGRLYTGISTSPSRRLGEHNTGKKGAKATRAGRPWKIVYVEEFDTKGLALKREYAIKRMPRARKLCLVGLAA